MINYAARRINARRPTKRWQAEFNEEPGTRGLPQHGSHGASPELSSRRRGANPPRRAFWCFFTWARRRRDAVILVLAMAPGSPPGRPQSASSESLVLAAVSRALERTGARHGTPLAPLPGPEVKAPLARRAARHAQVAAREPLPTDRPRPPLRECCARPQNATRAAGAAQSRRRAPAERRIATARVRGALSVSLSADASACVTRPLPAEGVGPERLVRRRARNWPTIVVVSSMVAINSPPVRFCRPVIRPSLRNRASMAS